MQPFLRGRFGWGEIKKANPKRAKAASIQYFTEIRYWSALFLGRINFIGGILDVDVKYKSHACIQAHRAMIIQIASITV